MGDLRFDSKVGGKQRRRLFWPKDKKRAIVAQSYASGLSVAEVARRHGVNANLLFTWRRQLRSAFHGAAAGKEIIPIAIAPVEEPAVAVSGKDRIGRIEIELCDGTRIVVGADVDAVALGHVLGALARR